MKVSERIKQYGAPSQCDASKYYRVWINLDNKFDELEFMSRENAINYLRTYIGGVVYSKKGLPIWAK